MRICCSSGLGVGLLMTTPSWHRLKRRIAVSVSAEAAPVSNISVHDEARDQANVASGSTKLELGRAVRKEVILVTGGAGFLGHARRGLW